ncbi:hypothetical protein DCE79_06400 [Lysinibacillus sp. 2017]|nr:hypothetical protein DCE79_06400 [Lysinibacillus sp. 2017]TGN37023.1 hypothetical protein E4L99_00615 [Lysinibacillus sp. S2017]
MKKPLSDGFVQVNFQTHTKIVIKKVGGLLNRIY